MKRIDFLRAARHVFSCAKLIAKPPYGPSILVGCGLWAGLLALLEALPYG